jgi:hypothetical protein
VLRLDEIAIEDKRSRDLARSTADASRRQRAPTGSVQVRRRAFEGGGEIASSPNEATSTERRASYHFQR